LDRSESRWWTCEVWPFACVVGLWFGVGRLPASALYPNFSDPDGHANRFALHHPHLVPGHRDPHSATPVGWGDPIDHQTGSGTGAHVENVNFSAVRQLDPHVIPYLAAWSGPRSRATLPGGGKGIPSQLERLPPP